MVKTTGIDTPPPAIELRNVTVVLTGEVIFRNVNLKINRGDTAVIIGPSGGGKSVLLKTMAGVFHPKEGAVFCQGVDVTTLKQEAKHELARRIGMQFQKSALFDELTAIDNIGFVLKEHTKMSPKEIEERALECLRAVGLEKYRDFHEYELSGGMKQRLGIARSIALKPEILFMDDPTAGLDPVNADNMATLILDLKNEINATLVIVTHDILRAEQFAGRIFIVANQAVKETGNAEQTLQSVDPLVHQFVTGDVHGPLTDGREIG